MNVDTHVWAYTGMTPTDGTYVPFLSVTARHEGIKFCVRAPGTPDGATSTILVTKEQARELVAALKPFLGE